MTIHDVLSWLKANNFPCSRAALYRLIDGDGFPRPVLHGRKGEWDRRAIQRWADRGLAASYSVDTIFGHAMFEPEMGKGVDWPLIVIRWADASEGDTGELVEAVAQRAGTNADTVELREAVAQRAGSDADKLRDAYRAYLAPL